MNLCVVDGPLTTNVLSSSVESRATKRWVITSRLDNDDALGRHFYERLDRATRLNDRTAINFLWGLQSTPWGLLRCRQVSNPFISLIEDRDARPLSTVRARPHTSMSSDLPTIQIGGQPAWLQVVHGRNLGNTPAGLPTRTKRHLEEFPELPPSERWRPSEYVRRVRPQERFWARIRHEFRKSYA